MRLLMVLASSSQLYSGIGRNIFELAERLTDRIELQFAIDDALERNVGVLRDFCSRHGFSLHVGRHASEPSAADYVNTELEETLTAHSWDAVECVGWASAATNRGVLEHVGGSLLVYTPHNQPAGSIPITARQRRTTEAVHADVLARADLVMCDSPKERKELAALAPPLTKYAYVPSGCDFRRFTPGSVVRRQQLLFVGDFAEPRKRFDRALAVFGGLRTQHRDLKLVVVGNRTTEAGVLIPEEMRPHVELRGYVTDDELTHAYAESLGLILLSDYEAFGIPVVEALASGTPAFVSDNDVARSLFGRFRGVHFCPVDDERAAMIVDAALRRGPAMIVDVLAERERLQAAFDWDTIAQVRWHALAAAWVLKHRIAGGAPL
jgi:glycosyltransferase involved in cell wall biosynthesis